MIDFFRVKTLINLDNDKSELTNFSDYQFLRNDYNSPVFFEGVQYPTVEHAFQAAKTEDFYERNRVLSASVSEARKLGRNLELRDDWDDVKLSVMEFLLRQKFWNNDDLAAQLISTNERPLVMEHSYDNFWGVVEDVGENHLGELLMKVRQELKSLVGVGGSTWSSVGSKESADNSLDVFVDRLWDELPNDFFDNEVAAREFNVILKDLLSDVGALVKLLNLPDEFVNNLTDYLSVANVDENAILTVLNSLANNYEQILVANEL